MTSTGVRWAFRFSSWNPSRTDLLLASSCVQLEEKQRLSKFVFKKDIKSSLIGLLMMRKFVSEATDERYNEIKFIRDAKGKPFIENTQSNKLHFNVSHQGDYTVFAGQIGDLQLGVDVMKLEYTGGKPLTEFFRLMTKHFSSEEWSTIKGAGNESEQEAMFCRFWCLKESYVKAIGVGITVNLQDICFKVKTMKLDEQKIVKDTELYVNGEKLNWQFEESLLDAQHCVSVAISETIAHNIFFKEIDFDELMLNCVALIPSDHEFSDNYFTKLDKA